MSGECCHELKQRHTTYHCFTPTCFWQELANTLWIPTGHFKLLLPSSTGGRSSAVLNVMHHMADPTTLTFFLLAFPITNGIIELVTQCTLELLLQHFGNDPLRWKLTAYLFCQIVRQIHVGAPVGFFCSDYSFVLQSKDQSTLFLSGPAINCWHVQRVAPSAPNTVWIACSNLTTLRTGEAVIANNRMGGCKVEKKMLLRDAVYKLVTDSLQALLLLNPAVFVENKYDKQAQ